MEPFSAAVADGCHREIALPSVLSRRRCHCRARPWERRAQEVVADKAAHPIRRQCYQKAVALPSPSPSLSLFQARLLAAVVAARVLLWVPAPPWASSSRGDRYPHHADPTALEAPEKIHAHVLVLPWAEVAVGKQTQAEAVPVSRPLWVVVEEGTQARRVRPSVVAEAALHSLLPCRADERWRRLEERQAVVAGRADRHQEGQNASAAVAAAGAAHQDHHQLQEEAGSSAVLEHPAP